VLRVTTLLLLFALVLPVERLRDLHSTYLCP
jgi:hypothetical protein